MKSPWIRRAKWITVAVIALPVILYAIGALNYLQKCSSARVSCLEHRKAGCNIDGEYNIGLGGPAHEASCDMHTEGGGWTLVANYFHRKGNSGAPLNFEPGVFPIQNQTILGQDEFGTPAWGHASTRTLQSLPYKEMRFKCMTSAHNRSVDFVLGEGKCFDYIRTGKGACIENKSKTDTEALVKESRSMPNNNSKIPGISDNAWKEQGDNAITNYPFYIDYRNHWSVGALPGRFECDDYEPGGTTSTFHQVWVR